MNLTKLNEQLDQFLQNNQIKEGLFDRFKKPKSRAELLLNEHSNVKQVLKSPDLTTKFFIYHDDKFDSDKEYILLKVSNVNKKKEYEEVLQGTKDEIIEYLYSWILDDWKNCSDEDKYSFSEDPDLYVKDDALLTKVQDAFENDDLAIDFELYKVYMKYGNESDYMTEELDPENYDPISEQAAKQLMLSKIKKESKRYRYVELTAYPVIYSDETRIHVRSYDWTDPWGHEIKAGEFYEASWDEMKQL